MLFSVLGNRILQGKLLNVKDSDFLTAFPNFELSALFGREELYQGSLAEQWMGSEFWQYGPMHQFISIPLYLLPSISSVMTFLFFLLSIIYFYTIKIYLITSNVILKSNQDCLGIILIVTLFYPFLSAINQRNLELLELFFVVVAASHYRKSNYLFSGVLIGLATGIKFLPIIILGFFLLERNRKAILGFLISFIPQIILAQFVFDWRRSFTFQLVSEGEPETIPLRQGLADVILRILGNSGGNYNVVFLLAAGGVVVLTTFFLVRFLSLQSEQNERWRIWPFLLAIICLIAPHSNNYYFVLFVPLIIEVYAYLRTRKIEFDTILFGFGLSLISSPLPLAVLWRLLPESSSGEVQNALQFVQNSSPMFFGGLIVLMLAMKNNKQILRLSIR